MPFGLCLFTPPECRNYFRSGRYTIMKIAFAAGRPRSWAGAFPVLLRTGLRSNVGFLTAAIVDAKTAAIHAKLAATTPDNLDQMKLHAGHVLHALDPSIETKGPGSGYGVKKAAAGALQHLDFAAKAEGASANVKLHATHVAASLGDAIEWTDQAIATAQKIRAAPSAAEAAPLSMPIRMARSDGRPAKEGLRRQRRTWN